MILWRALGALLFCLLAFSASAQTERTAIFQPEPRPMPASVQLEAGLQLEYYFTSLTQGGVGLLRLSGANIAGARAEFRQKDIPFFHIAGDAWYALIIADVDSVPGTHQLLVHAQREADATTIHRRLRVTPGNFIVQNFALPGLTDHLVFNNSESVHVALLRSIMEDHLAEPQWDASGFALPLDSELTSPFGTFRLLNDKFETRHMGWDQNAPEGTPIRAMASGVVDFVRANFAPGIFGNFVMIDHGYSLFSNYAHLSETLVERGQFVEAGQIIGLSGNTGRSSAPHLHWEILLHGEWIDGAAFLKLWLPAPGRENTDANIGR